MAKQKNLIVAVENAGSSSGKYDVFEISCCEGKLAGVKLLAHLSGERLDTFGSQMSYKVPEKRLKQIVERPNMTHEQVARMAFHMIGSQDYGVVSSLEEINVVVHRVVNAGPYMTAALLTDDVIVQMEKNVNRAPEHNPRAIRTIKVCREMMPNAIHIAVPDSSAHADMPEEAYLYGLPLDLARKFRKMGFHGSVILNVIRKLRDNELKEHEEMRLMVVHLGNGCSITAIKDGKSVDTSMGLSPLTGTMMGTRSGTIDPTIIPLMAEELKVSEAEVIEILNKKSGLLGISGVSSDFRDILEAMYNGNKNAKLAVNMFIYKASAEVGKYMISIGGMKQLVFSGGIGENSAFVRREICKRFEFLGLKLNNDLNEVANGHEMKISATDSSVDIWVIPADEAEEMSKQAVELMLNNGMLKD